MDLQPNLQPTCNDDLISREQAIKALDDKITITGSANAVVVKDYVERVRQKLIKLPSAEPKVIRCKDCKHYVKDYGWNCIEYMVCSISPLHRVLRKPNDFCSRAKRRTDESD